jgi:hypothetical protein
VVAIPSPAMAAAETIWRNMPLQTQRTCLTLIILGFPGRLVWNQR